MLRVWGAGESDSHKESEGPKIRGPRFKVRRPKVRGSGVPRIRELRFGDQAKLIHCKIVVEPCCHISVCSTSDSRTLNQSVENQQHDQHWNVENRGFEYAASIDVGHRPIEGNAGLQHPEANGNGTNQIDKSG